MVLSLHRENGNKGHYKSSFIFEYNYKIMDTVEINNRYTYLANDTCCLSCGGAVDKSEAKAGEVCVDLGSGRGTDVLRLAEVVGEQGFVYGVDVTDEMIRKAGKTANKMGVKNVEFIKADLESIPLKEGLADLIVSNCTLNHVSDKESVWKEIFRMLKNGGRFVISDIYSIGDVPEEYRTDPEAVAECWAGSIPRKAYFDVMKRAGFPDVKVLEESSPYSKGAIEVCSFTITATKDEFSCV